MCGDGSICKTGWEYGEADDKNERDSNGGCRGECKRCIGDGEDDRGMNSHDSLRYRYYHMVNTAAVTSIALDRKDSCHARTRLDCLLDRRHTWT